MLEYLQFFIENWYVIVTFICALILAIMKIVEFIGYPTEKKKKEIKNRLLAYATQAELELGSSTGKLKLAQVYDFFCEAFPYTKKWFTLEQFDALVGEILPTMREILGKKKEETEIELETISI